MNILLVYPKHPDTFWSCKVALRFISKKAGQPPLGLITVSAMLPATWQKKLVDMNISELKKSDILWADYIFISAMYVQKESVNKVIEECLKYKVKIVAGGPLFTQDYENYPQIDHFILNEAEITLPLFLKDLETGHPPKKVYKTKNFADITSTPTPDFHLLSMRDYAMMCLQVTRGCPFACDFCEITSLYGHKVRMKDTRQVLNELDELYKLNWHGTVFIVDDNLIGNKKEVKYDLLPAMKLWMQAHKYPFNFTMQTSINLADDEDLMKLMTETGFSSTFIGIETPDDTTLQECNKVQNLNRDLLLSVNKILNAGIKVVGGFIVGFDSDSPAIFQRHIEFIQQSGIVFAMVGLLNAPKNTRLYKRLESENRLTVEATGETTDHSINFKPIMNQNELLEGYDSIIRNIYSVKPYYKRIRHALLIYKKPGTGKKKLEFSNLAGFIKTIFIIGLVHKGRSEYWKLLVWTIFRRPGSLSDAVIWAVYGLHFRTIFRL